MACGKHRTIGCSAIWTILTTLTFVCCSLIVYNVIIRYDIFCFMKDSYASSSKIETAMQKDEKCMPTCTTQECITIANRMTRSINAQINPCEDFYEFACGNYDANFGKEENASSMYYLMNDLYKLVKGVIETSPKTQIAGSAANKLKTMYNSCMDIRSSDFSSTKTLQRFIQSMGILHWPNLDQNFTFPLDGRAAVLAKLAAHEEFVFLQLYGSHDKQESVNNSDTEFKTIVMSYIVQQYPTYYFENEEKDLKEVVFDVLHSTHADKGTVNETWHDFLKLEKELQDLRVNNYEAGAATCGHGSEYGSEMNCSAKGSERDNIVCRYIQLVWTFGKVETFSKDRVYVVCDDAYYIDKLPQVLEKFNDRELANYIALRVFINNQKNMGFYKRNKVNNFIQRRANVLMKRWEFCISWVMENMPGAVSHLYASELSSKEALDEVDKMVEECRNRTVDIFGSQSWIEEEQKNQLQAFVKNVKHEFTEFVNWCKNDTKANEHYKQFTATRYNFMKNIIRLKKFSFSSRRSNPDSIWYEKDVLTVSATTGGDIIQFSFGILLPPVFQLSYPKLFKYANFGFVIGHEVGHSVNYFLKHEGEISNATTQKYIEKTKCFVDKYSESEVKEIGMKPNGMFTESEDMADIIGLYLSEKLVQEIINENRFTLPGLPYAPEELSYISRAQIWCESISNEMKIDHLTRNEHTLARFRINVPFKNSERFSRTFNCPLGSPMNPTEKCSIFD